MNANLKTLVSVSLMLFAGTAKAITMPAPPPELSDTLTRFKTQVQLNEDKSTSNDAIAPFLENVEIESAPFVPGDDSAGVLRLALIYQTKATIGVPSFGASILRFYDLEGIPFEIASFKCENQGFVAENTASPSELLVKQNYGATTTTLVVNLVNYDSPLIFTLTPVKLNRQEVAINTILNSIKVPSVTNAQGYIYPKLQKVPKSNPNAQVVKFDKDAISKVEETLIDAVRGIKQNAQ